MPLRRESYDVWNMLSEEIEDLRSNYYRESFEADVTGVSVIILEDKASATRESAMTKLASTSWRQRTTKKNPNKTKTKTKNQTCLVRSLM